MVATVARYSHSEWDGPGMKSVPCSQAQRGTPATGPRSAQGHVAGEEGEKGPRPAPGATAAAGSTGVDHGAPPPRRLGREASAQGPVVVEQRPRDAHKVQMLTPVEEEWTGEPCGQPEAPPRWWALRASHAAVGIRAPSLLKSTAGAQ